MSDLWKARRPELVWFLWFKTFFLNPICPVTYLRIAGQIHAQASSKTSFGVKLIDVYCIFSCAVAILFKVAQSKRWNTYSYNKLYFSFLTVMFKLVINKDRTRVLNDGDMCHCGNTYQIKWKRHQKNQPFQKLIFCHQWTILDWTKIIN